MTTLRQAAQQALECIERLNAHGWILADFEDEVYAAINALKAALEQQEPSVWRDMVVVTLVRESIDKHRARELADHFAAQPEQEPVAFYHPRNGFYWAKPTSIFAPTIVDVPPMALYTAPPAAQRPWQGLTEFQFAEIYNKWNDTNGSTPWGLNQALESKLRNLNK